LYNVKLYNYSIDIFNFAKMMLRRIFLIHAW